MAAIKTRTHRLDSSMSYSLDAHTRGSDPPEPESLTEQLVEWQVDLLERMFDERSYVDFNSDLADLKDDSSALFEHFNLFGYQELRKFSRNFDPLAYLLFNEDVRDLGMNPYVHFLKFGWIEDRRASILDDRLPQSASDTGVVLGSVPRTRTILPSGHRLTPCEVSSSSDDPYGLMNEAIGVLQARSQRLSLLEEKLDLLTKSMYSYERAVTAIGDELKVARKRTIEAELRVTQIKTAMSATESRNVILEGRVDALERSRAVRLASFARKLFHASA